MEENGEIMGERAKFKQWGNSRFEPPTVWVAGDTVQTMIMVDMIIRGGISDVRGYSTSESALKD